MQRILKSLIILSLGAAATGCVVAPVGPRAYVAAPGVAVIAPAPYLAVRPYYYYGRRW